METDKGSDPPDWSVAAVTIGNIDTVHKGDGYPSLNGCCAHFQDRIPGQGSESCLLYVNEP